MTSGIQGYCAPKFEGVRTAFEANFAGGFEVGASVVLVIDGRTEVDLWGGHADPHRREPWRQDTIVNVWSTTKTMMFLVCLILADRGELDLDAPVSRYWPEFAANGKENLQLKYVLDHRAGMALVSEPIPRGSVYDHAVMAAALARQPAAWEPGTDAGYHVLTQGFILAEVVRRVTGKTLGTFFRTEIAEPLGLDGRWAGPFPHPNMAAPAGAFLIDINEQIAAGLSGQV